jgi:hypothetical protein
MRSLLLILLLAVGCDKGERSKTQLKAIPPGPYTVRYDCFHSNEPFGKGSQTRNQAFDLGARTYTRHFYEQVEVSNEVRPLPPPETQPLSGDRVTAINAAVEKVLRGGPYKPEYPVPEGAPCHLVISSGPKELFKIDKAYTKEPDAVSELVGTLVP